MGIEDFEIFAEDGAGRPGSISEILDLIRHHVEEHDLSIEDALGVIVDMVRPGNGPNSHDVRPVFMGAMTAYGYYELGQKFASLYVNEMPWGIGFSIAVEEGLDFNKLASHEQRAIVQSLCVVLQTGGMPAHVGDDNHIVITGPLGQEARMDVDNIVSQFVQQMNETLGPDGPDTDDPMRRWMP